MSENNNAFSVETHPISIPRVDDIDKKIAELTAQNNEYQSYMGNEKKSDSEIVPTLDPLPINQNLGAAEALQHVLESHRDSVAQADAALSEHEISITTTPNHYTGPKDLSEYTPEQEKNNEIMEGLPEKYPHAFVERSTDDGRKYLLLKKIYMETSSLFNEAYSDGGCIDRNKALMLSYRGVSVIDFIYDPAEYDFTQVLDQEQRILHRGPISGFSRDIDIYINKMQEYSKDSNPDAVLCYKFESKDFADVNLEILKKIFVDMEREHEDDIVKEKPTAKNILDSL